MSPGRGVGRKVDKSFVHSGTTLGPRQGGRKSSNVHRARKPILGRIVALLVGLGACVLIVGGILREQGRITDHLIRSRVLEPLSRARYREPASAVALRLTVLGASVETLCEVTARVESATADGWVDETEVKAIFSSICGNDLIRQGQRDTKKLDI